MKKLFTLLELLVVIGIISVLYTLLSTGLNYAKLKAKQANDINNLKQLGAAIYLYSEDNNQRLPYIPNNPNSNSLYLLLPYTNYQYKLFHSATRWGKIEVESPDKTYFKHPHSAYNNAIAGTNVGSSYTYSPYVEGTTPTTLVNLTADSPLIVLNIPEYPNKVFVLYGDFTTVKNFTTVDYQQSLN